MAQDETGERRVRREPFKRRDIERAMKSARAEGLEIGAVVVHCNDGTIIEVRGKDSAHPDSSSDLERWIAKRQGDARPA
jgi:tRNA(Arg) A34 adenosine deaminase TadA